MLIVIPNFRRLIAIFCKIYVEKFVISLFSKINNKIVIYLTFLFHFCSHEYYQDEVSQQNRAPPLVPIVKSAKSLYLFVTLTSINPKTQTGPRWWFTLLELICTVFTI